MGLTRLLLLLFIAIPLLEIYLLIQIGGVIGAFPTVVLVVLTAAIGVVLLRWQGLYTLFRVQSSIARGELPALPLLEGVVLLVCGALLLTPGFFTDAIGFLGLVPSIRQWFVKRLLGRGLMGYVLHRHDRQTDRRNSRTIEGESRREDD